MPQMNVLHKSPIGDVVDVATPSSKKLQILGLLWTALAFIFLVVTNYCIYDFFLSQEPSLDFSNVVLIFGALLMPIIFWFCLGNAIQRFQSAFSTKRYFRVNSNGISMCIPDNTFSSAMFFRSQDFHFNLTWDKIRTWYPYTYSVNAIPVERSIVFETLDNKKLSIKTYLFAEKQNEIANNIAYAKVNITSVDQVKEEVFSNETIADNVLTNSLPEGLAESDIKINRKQEILQEISLTSIPIEYRLVKLEETAKFLENHLKQLYSQDNGYNYHQKSYSPFEDRPQLCGLKVVISRGIFCGYEIAIEPTDFECRSLKMFVRVSRKISQIILVLSGIIATISGFATLFFIGGSILVFLLVGILVFLISLGVLNLPLYTFLYLSNQYNKQNQELNNLKQEIKTLKVLIN